VLVNTASNRSIDEYKAQTLTSTRATKIDTRVEHLLKHLVIVHCHYFIIRGFLPNASKRYIPEITPPCLVGLVLVLTDE
jgi:hypothetical protein